MDHISADTQSCRNKCAACYRQFNRKEHLVEHMRAAHHSEHDPRCVLCAKHCRSLEALRHHLGVGAAAGNCKPDCARAFAARGCVLCLAVLPTAASLRAHHAACRLSRVPAPPVPRSPPPTSSGDGGGGALALGCKMVGGGSDGTLDLCARVCVVDEQERPVYEAFVRPPLPVTHYRYETTGIRPEHLREGSGGAVPAKHAQERLLELLLDGEPPWKARSPSTRGRARVVVGHGLDHDLDALAMDYPGYLKRDTARYPALMKTSKLSNSLRFLTQTYLGYDIQTGHQHPYEDCVAAMRLYLRMRAQRHVRHPVTCSPPAAGAEPFPSWRQRELEAMSPEELLHLSKPDYYCWCLDNVN